MGESIKAGREGKQEGGFDRDTIERTIRERVRAIIEEVVEAELDTALGATASQRVGTARQGYRHGHRERTLTTSTGPTTFAMPRARVRDRKGRHREWQSETVRRYERRSERVDAGIVHVDLHDDGVLAGVAQPDARLQRRVAEQRLQAQDQPALGVEPEQGRQRSAV